MRCSIASNPNIETILDNASRGLGHVATAKIGRENYRVIDWPNTPLWMRIEQLTTVRRSKGHVWGRSYDTWRLHLLRERFCSDTTCRLQMLRKLFGLFISRSSSHVFVGDRCYSHCFVVLLLQVLLLLMIAELFTTADKIAQAALWLVMCRWRLRLSLLCCSLRMANRDQCSLAVTDNLCLLLLIVNVIIFINLLMDWSYLCSTSSRGSKYHHNILMVSIGLSRIAGICLLLDMVKRGHLQGW